MNVSSLIGKQLLSPSGEKIGYLTKAFLTRDLRKISSFVCVDESEEEFYLPFRAVIAAKDAVMIGRARLHAPTGVAHPVGTPVYSSAGEWLGVIGDFYPEGTDSAKFRILNGDKSLFCEADRITLGETAILYSSPEEKRSSGTHRAVRRAARKTAPDESTTRLQQTSHAAPNSVPANDGSAQHPAVGTSFCINRTNLIGLRVKRSVFDENGRAIALAGERITPRTLAAARRSNLLLTLTVNTLTNLI